MVIGIGVSRLTELMNIEYAKYQGTQTGLTILGPAELEIFDVAVPKLLNRHYKQRLSGILYSTYAGAYLVGLMKAKKALGDLMYTGNDGDAGILSREISPGMFDDEAGTQKDKWELDTQAAATGWQDILGNSSADPSVITNDEFGAIVISHLTSMAATPNLLECRYTINGNPRTPQYLEPAFKLNDNMTYQLDVPILLVKNTKIYMRGNVETANQPVEVMQGGMCFAAANWLNSHDISLT